MTNVMAPSSSSTDTSSIVAVAGESLSGPTITSNTVPFLPNVAGAVALLRLMTTLPTFVGSYTVSSRIERVNVFRVSPGSKTSVPLVDV